MALARLQDLWSQRPSLPLRIYHNSLGGPEKQPILLYFARDGDSFDVNCLRWLLLLRLHGINPILEPCYQQDASSSGSLPVLVHRGTSWSGEQIQGYLDSEGKSLIYAENVIADVEALESLLENELYPAVEYALWFEPKNFSNYTVKTYGKAFLPTAFRRLVLWQQYGEKWEQLHAHYGQQQLNKDQIYQGAARTLKSVAVKIAINKRLNNNNHSWICATKEPTRADVLLFACLHSILIAKDLPCPDLVMLIRGHSVLLSYTEGAYQHWFPAAGVESKSKAQ